MTPLYKHNIIDATLLNDDKESEKKTQEKLSNVIDTGPI
jgi:hypothetical protein